MDGHASYRPSWPCGTPTGPWATIPPVTAARTRPWCADYAGEGAVSGQYGRGHQQPDLAQSLNRRARPTWTACSRRSSSALDSRANYSGIGRGESGLRACRCLPTSLARSAAPPAIRNGRWCGWKRPGFLWSSFRSGQRGVGCGDRLCRYAAGEACGGYGDRDGIGGKIDMPKKEDKPSIGHRSGLPEGGRMGPRVRLE